MQAPKTPFEMVKKIVEKELGKPIEEVYDCNTIITSYLIYIDFEEKPLASASLAQVHKAHIKGTPEDQFVAVKVQHQWIKEQVPGDLQLIQLATDIAGMVFPDFRYGWLPHEFKTRLPQELDFRKEAANAEKCKEMFKHDKRVYVPTVNKDLTTERVLTMTFEKGIPVSHVKEMHA